MKSNISNKLLIFFVRHGERLDQVKAASLSKKEQDTKFPKCDPPLTENGKKLGFNAGQLVAKML